MASVIHYAPPAFLTMSWFSKLLDFRRRMSPEGVVRFYQEFGFLGAEPPELVLCRFKDEMGQALDPKNRWDDPYLLALDREHVWADDPECDVCAENEVYQEVLPEWASLSGKLFAPTEIEESWDSETGPIRLSFNLGGRRCRIHPDYLHDYLDLNILRQINGLIAETGGQFLCASDANFAVVFFGDAIMRRRLKSVREFPFLF